MQLQCPYDTDERTKYTFPKRIIFDVLLLQSSFEIGQFKISKTQSGRHAIEQNQSGPPYE